MLVEIVSILPDVSWGGAVRLRRAGLLVQHAALHRCWEDVLTAAAGLLGMSNAGCCVVWCCRCCWTAPCFTL